MGRERHGERLLNKAAVLVALFAVCLRECSYGIYNKKSLTVASCQLQNCYSSAVLSERNQEPASGLPFNQSGYLLI